MKFLDNLKNKKKEEKEEEIPKKSKLDRITSIMKRLNRPLGSGLGFNPSPKRPLMERQLGIPEYIEPLKRMNNFIKKPKPVPKPKETIVSWRPRPGIKSRKGETW